MIWIYLLILFAFTYLSYKKPLVGIIFLLPLIIAMNFLLDVIDPGRIFTSVTIVDPAKLSTSAITFISCMIAVLISRKSTDSAACAKAIVKWILILTSLTIFQIGVFIVFGMWGLLTLFFILLVTGAHISLKLSSKFSRPICILSTISAAMKQNLPLTVVLEAAEQSRPDKVAAIFKKINYWLIRGKPLSEAVRLGYARCPGHIPAMMAAAEKINQLPLAVEMLLKDMIKKSRDRAVQKNFVPAYPTVIFLTVLLITIFAMKLVIPTFSSTLIEMCDGEPLPMISNVVFGVAGVIVYRLWWLILLIILILLPTWVYVKIRPRRPEKPLIVSKMGDFVKWHVPVARWIEKNYSLLRTVEYLRLSLNVDATIDQAITGACELDINHCFKKRLKNWLRRVRGGGDIAESAKKAKLGSLLPWALAGNNIPASLEMTETVLRANYNYRIRLICMICEPLSVIILASIVASVVFAIFLPMVSIINHLAGQVIPF